MEKYSQGNVYYEICLTLLVMYMCECVSFEFAYNCVVVLEIVCLCVCISRQDCGCLLDIAVAKCSIILSRQDLTK